MPRAPPAGAKPWGPVTQVSLWLVPVQRLRHRPHGLGPGAILPRSVSSVIGHGGHVTEASSGEEFAGSRERQGEPPMLGHREQQDGTSSQGQAKQAPPSSKKWTLGRGGGLAVSWLRVTWGGTIAPHTLRLCHCSRTGRAATLQAAFWSRSSASHSRDPGRGLAQRAGTG